MITSLSDPQALNALVNQSKILAIAFADSEENGFSEQFGRVAARHDDVTFARAALPDAKPIAEMFGITETPALVLFREGLGLYAGPAAFNEAQLEAMLQRAARLDIAAARAEIERERIAEEVLATHLVCPTARRGSI
jgi:thioredoxin 1